MRIGAPRKPNSAKRQMFWVDLFSVTYKVYARLTGTKPTTIQKHSEVLLEGGNSKDLANVNYRIVWGKLAALGSEPTFKRCKRRSKFGLMNRQREEFLKNDTAELSEERDKKRDTKLKQKRAKLLRKLEIYHFYNRWDLE